MKKLILAAILAIFVISGVSARGLSEEELTGSISFVLNEAGETVLVLVTPDGSYVLNIPAEQLADLNLEEGQEVTVKGELLGNDDDGEDELNVRIVTIDGRRYKLELEDADDDEGEDEDSPAYDDDDGDDDGYDDEDDR